MDEDRGDLVEFGKKRNTDYDFSLSLYMWAEYNNINVAVAISLIQSKQIC